MQSTELYQRLNEVFRDVFDDASITVTADTVSADVDGWDSLIHITLMQAIEDEFAIRLSMKEIVSLHNVGELAAAIAAKV
ncbi:MAG: acyl carrier protein [Angelakisella sp.]